MKKFMFLIAMSAIFVITSSSISVKAGLPPNGGGGWIGGGGLPGDPGGGAIGIMELNCLPCAKAKQCTCIVHTNGSWTPGHAQYVINSTAFDYGLMMNNYKLDSSIKSTSVFIPSSDVLKGNQIEGVGYINIAVEYDPENRNILYILCDACPEQKYTDFEEWLKACQAINGFHETILNNFLVHPNPASNGKSFELEKSCNMKIVLYDLDGQELLQVYDGFTNSGFFNKIINTGNLIIRSIFSKNLN